MKTRINLCNIMLLIVTSLLLLSCSEQTKLNNQEAQTLLVKVLKLPQSFNVELNGENYNWYGKNHACYRLQEAGYISVNTHGFGG